MDPATTSKPRTRNRTKFIWVAALACLATVTVFAAISLHARIQQYRLNRRLIASLVGGNATEALDLVEAGADPNTNFIPPARPTLMSLLRQVFRPNRNAARSYQGPTAFLMAIGDPWAGDRNVGTAQFLDADADKLVLTMIHHGADITARCNDHKTALMLAIWDGHTKSAEALLDNGAAVNIQDDTKWTALDFALNSPGDRDMEFNLVQKLLNNGANPNLLMDDGNNALGFAEIDAGDARNATNRDGKSKGKTKDTTIVLLLRHFGAVKHPPEPKTSAPIIARLLGVRVGANGQDALYGQLGKGIRTTGGHPNSHLNWQVQFPRSFINADGFCNTNEGYAIETLSWSLENGRPSGPKVRQLPKHPGWLNCIVPGMDEATVDRLRSKSLPPPLKTVDTWTWTATGFVRPNAYNEDVFTTWKATLTFTNHHLSDITVSCEGGFLAL